MTAVNFPLSVGGDGSTVSDDANATTGLANGGHRTRFVPALAQVVAVAGNTVSQAQAALASQVAAAASAASAMNSPGTQATSATSLTVGLGSKSLTLSQTGKGFVVGQYVQIVSTASVGNWMVGAITAFVSGTGAMTVSVSNSGGSGTIDAWAITPSNPPELPSQSGNAGRYLKTDGSIDLWTPTLDETPGVTLASAATVDIGAALSNTVNITGSVTITSFGTAAAGVIRRLVFQAALTITHNATSLILPSQANIVTAAADIAEFISTGSGNWKCVLFSRAAIALPASAGESGYVLTSQGTGQGVTWLSPVPAGAVEMFARNTAPTGWLKANGATISRTTYATLFAAIGTTFGAGDGSTTFKIPDLRGEFLRSWDDARGIDTGRVFGSAQTDAMQGHFHSTSSGSGTSFSGPDTPQTQTPGSANTGSPVTDGVNGAPRTASETRPRSIALLACIKF